MSRTNIGISCFPKDGKKWVFIGKNVKMAENHEWVSRHFCGEGLILGERGKPFSCHHDWVLSHDAPLSHFLFNFTLN